MNAYKKLERRFEKLGRLQGVLAVLRWDDSTMMPPGGADARAEQKATIRGMHHELLTDPELADWFDEVGDGEGLDEWQRANLREMRSRWRHTVCVPPDLVRQFSRCTSKCETVWRGARADDDFARVAPHLERVVELVRRIAEIKAEALGLEPYDALLDRYEPGMTAARLDELFGQLEQFLPDVIDEAIARQSRVGEPTRPAGPFDEADQQRLAERLMKAWGFDFDHGRLDTSHHPFCGGIPEDVRVTTKYDEGDFLRSAMAVLHETGHALYNQGLPAGWRRQPVGRARSSGVHESQSLFVEMQIGRSRPFTRWAVERYSDAFGDDRAWDEENLHRLKTNVERSLIRVDADEVTYPAHVILRYRLEKAMVDGQLDVHELPEAFDQQMERLVGVTPEDDRDGCMQDIHWMAGMFGYFPTYTLGALMAAQLFAAADEQIGGIDEAVNRGEFAVIVDWLRDNVHSVGCRLTTDELLSAATGSRLDAQYFKAHLIRRYLGDDPN